MNKIGFIALAHPDYIADGCASSFADRAVALLQKNGVRVVYSGNLVANPFASREDALAIIRNNCDGVILFLSSWMECPVAMAAVTELKHLPIMIWGFPMWEQDGKEMSTGSYVSYAMFRGVLARVGVVFAEVLGMPEEENTEREVLTFCRVANVKARLKCARIGLVGYTSMSIYTGTFDHVLMRWKIGPEIEQSDSYSLIRRAEKFTDAQKEKALELLRNKACCMNDILPEMFDKAMGLYLAIEELKNESKLDAVNVKCQYEFSKEYGMTLCVPLSMAASESFVTSCEGDILCTVSMLILQYLTGQAIAYGDAINHSGNVLKMSPCGFMPFQLASSEATVRNFMEGVGFTGIQTSCTMKAGKVTVLRLIEDVGDYHFLCTTGEGLADTKPRQGCMPALDIIPDCDIQELVKNFAGQHFAICYGDVTGDIERLSKLLGIKCIRL